MDLACGAEELISGELERRRLQRKNWIRGGSGFWGGGGTEATPRREDRVGYQLLLRYGRESLGG
jgi:hypothetical protein